MRITQVGYALGVAAAVAVFAGCSGNGSSLGTVAQAPGAGSSVVRQHSPISLLGPKFSNVHVTKFAQWQGAKPDVNVTYITGCAFAAGCNMYKQNHAAVVGTIPATFVNDLCTDPSGNVWIPDGGAQTTSEYPHGSTTAIKTLTGSGVQPSSCAVGNNGTVYVGNIAADTIDVYANGSTTPTRQLVVNSAFTGGSPGSGFVGNLSIDEHNNLAASWEDFATGTAGIDEFTHAHQAGEHTVLNTVSIAGVRFDRAEHIVYTDLGTGGGVNIWNGSVCNSYPGVDNGGDGLFSAINKPNSKIYTGDFLNNVVVQESFSDCTGGGTVQFHYAGFPNSSEVEGAAVSLAQTN